jgi:hypothetical protein
VAVAAAAPLAAIDTLQISNELAYRGVIETSIDRCDISLTFLLTADADRLPQAQVLILTKFNNCLGDRTRDEIVRRSSSGTD